MKIQVNTDKNIQGDDALIASASEIVSAALKRFSDQITRVELHLSDENAHKGGLDDKRCLIEVRLKGLQPATTSHQAATVEQAIAGAADKMKRALETTLEKLSQR